MSELTKEYFDQTLDKRLKNITTKEDLDRFVAKQDLDKALNKATKGLATKEDLKHFATKQDLKGLATKSDLKEAVDDLARIVNTGFQEQQNYLEKKLDVRERMNSIEKDVVKIKVALNLDN